MRSTPRMSRRGGMVAIWFELLLGGAQITVTGAGAYAMTRGHFEWREAQRRLAASGYSMDVREIARGAILDAENFGATEALRGIAVREEDQTASIKAKIHRLKEMSLTPSHIKGTPERPLPSLDFGKARDWQWWRNWLKNPGGWDVPSGEPDDAKAVLAGLRSRDEALIKELMAAARRPRAGLVPGPAQRMREMVEEGTLMPESLEVANACFPVFIHLLFRLEAGLAAGDHTEVKDVLPVLFAIIRMTDGETNLSGRMRSDAMEARLMSVMHKGIQAHQLTEEDLAGCQKFFSSRDGALSLKTAVNMEAAVMVRAFQITLKRELDMNPYADDPQERRSWMERTLTERVVVTGNCAYIINDFLSQARCLEKADWPGLLAVTDKFSTEAGELFEGRGGSPLLYFNRISHSLAAGQLICFPSFYPEFARPEFRRRMMIAACALERRRLEGQEMPDTLAELPKRLLAEVPLDVDGKPIRYRPAPGGFVLWSVGLNLKDDWKGAAPDREVLERRARDQADWQVRVP